MRKLILLLSFVLAPFYVYADNKDIISSFCSDYGITYDNYSDKDDTVLISNIKYGGITARSAEIKGKGPYKISISDISGKDYTIGYIKADVLSLSALFSAIDTLSSDVDKNLTEERYMAEEEVMCEEEKDSCNDGEIIMTEVHNKNWDINLSDLLEKAKSLGFTNLTIGNIRSPTFNVDILELSNLDMKTYLTDMNIKNLNFKTSRSAPDTIFYNEFKSLGFSINSVELNRLDFISFVHFLADVTKQGSYITARYPHWYEVYAEKLASYFIIAPFSIQSVRNFDAEIIENGVAVHIKNANLISEMKRGEAITDSDLKFSINIKADDAALTDPNAKNVFKNNSGSMDINVTQKRLINNSIKDNTKETLIGNKLSVTSPKHFNINLDSTYINAFTNKPSNYEVNLNAIIMIDRLFNDTIYRLVVLRLDDYIPVLEHASLKNVRFTDVAFSYEDKGLSDAIKGAPKFKFDKMKQALKSLNTAPNGKEIYGMLVLFLNDPKSLSFDLKAKDGDFMRYPQLAENYFWGKGHSMSVEANGQKRM